MVCFPPEPKRSIFASRSEAAPSAIIRPPSATAGATEVLKPVLSDDPQLAELVAVWYRLPQAVLVGIIAIVKAAGV
jgi:hypothetical protein